MTTTRWLRVEACGLCGTDHEEYTGQLFPGYAFVPGHESIGVVEAVGDAAARRWNVRAGQRVAVEVFLSCGACAQCRAGTYRRCERHGLRDMYGFVPADRAPGLWGGYAQYQYLAPDSLLLPVPESLDSVTATMFNPLGAGIRWAVTVPDLQPGAVVAVLGPGVRGLSAAAAAREAGAGFVMVTGLGERDADRLALARDFGADLAVDVATDDPVRALRGATGSLADVVVDVTAKAPAALGQAVALARAGGTDRAGGDTRDARHAGVRSRPRGLQGAADARRARGRRRRVPRRARAARDRASTRLPICRGASSTSTASTRSSAPWPARAVHRRCTASSRPARARSGARRSSRVACASALRRRLRRPRGCRRSSGAEVAPAGRSASPVKSSGKLRSRLLMMRCSSSPTKHRFWFVTSRSRRPITSMSSVVDCGSREVRRAGG